ncbi:MAG: hypothetical protein ACQKBU_08760, partial [Verrucomicrobiales bacterium]
MYAVLSIPQFPLAALVAGKRVHAGASVAMVEGRQAKSSDKNQVRFCSASAWANGVEVGMTVAQAMARCPDLEVWDPSPEDEVSLDQGLLDLAVRVSPDFEVT